MTDQMFSNPLRWKLLVRASMPEHICPEVERDRIIAMFPGLEHDDTVRKLAESRQSREAGKFQRHQQIIAALIEADRNSLQDNEREQ